MLYGKKLPVDEINLVGGRKSAKTTTIQLVEALIATMGIPKVGMIALRHKVMDKDQLVEDYKNTYDAYEIDYKYRANKSTMTIGNQDIRFLGVNDKNKNVAKKSGLAKFGNVKYILVFFEERFEFDEVDIRAMVEAIRSINPDNKDVQFLYINACNPWTKQNEYIKYCGRWQTWNINQLKTTGSQIGVYNIPIGDNKYKRALFHYTNWRVAKDYLSESEIKLILDTWNFDKKRAATTDWGLPGYESGAIYTHMLNNLGKAIYQEHQYLTGGVDYGWGRDSSSGKTVAHFMGYTSGTGIDVYGEYVQSNHIVAKAPDKVAQEIVQFFHTQMKKYTESIGWPGTALNLSVKVDNMAIGLIQILNDTAKKYGMRWLRFSPSAKFPVNDRIEITLSAMYRHQLRLAPEVKLLKEEMEFSNYEETKSGVQKRIKVNDHALNAFEYGMEKFMYKIAKENQLTKLTLKREKIW